MEATDLLRAGVVAGLAYGVWRGWKALPSPVILEGKRYYRQPDGTYRTLLGRRVRNSGLLSTLAALDNARSKQSPSYESTGSQPL